MIMKNKKICLFNLLFILVLVVTGLGFSLNSMVWQKSGFGIYESDIRDLAVDPTNSSLIYAATSRAVYKSQNKGKNFKAILFKGEQMGVNDVYIVPEQPEIIYAATDAGLYATQNSGQTWQKIYSASDEDTRRSLCVVRDSDELYLGTQTGLYHKYIYEENWHKMKGDLGHDPIYHCAQEKDFLYFATHRALFRLNKFSLRLKQVFATGIGGLQNEEEDAEFGAAPVGSEFIKFVHVVDEPEPALFLASSNGIEVSHNHGESFQRIPTGQIPLENLTSLIALLSIRPATVNQCLQGRDVCYALLAGTKEGAFFYTDEKWTPIYKGLETNVIQDLMDDRHGAVYAATDRGVFILPADQAFSFDGPMQKQLNVDYKNMDELFNHEPSISQVHQWAIDYAEVHPDKIKNWRYLAKKKAWFPKVTVGADMDQGRTISDKIWGSYTGGGQHYIGPDGKNFDEGFGVDANFSWDFSELIWSTDQTTIDSRSKSMVELREEILDRVTRLYFERRRIQIEMIMTPVQDPQGLIDRKMRIAELTALIDSLTGGEFSRLVREVEV